MQNHPFIGKLLFVSLRRCDIMIVLMSALSLSRSSQESGNMMMSESNHKLYPVFLNGCLKGDLRGKENYRSPIQNKDGRTNQVDRQTGKKEKA